jgi:FkbM family methyltransferase
MTQPNGARRYFRDLFVGCLAHQPQAVKDWEFRNFQRYILWMLFHLEGGEIVETAAGPPGQRFRMRLHWGVHTGYAVGSYEPAVIAAVRENLRAEDTCLDVGGHVGYLSVLMAKIVGPAGKVVAFEPMPDSFEVLRENVRLNHLENVEMVQAAVGETETELSLVFETSERLSWTPSVIGHSVRGERGSIRVPAVALDTYVETKGLRPRLIKIDVEGAELGVLRGARQTLLKHKPVVVVEVHGPGGEHEHDVLAFLKSCGYSARPIEVRTTETIYLAAFSAGSD